MIFQVVQKNMEILGISRTQSIHVFHGKVFIGAVALSIAVISHFKFLFRGDLTFEEGMQSFFYTTVTVMCSLCYASIILQNEHVFELFDKFEATIQLFGESKSKFEFDFF